MDGHVHQTNARIGLTTADLLRQEDHSGAGAPDRHARLSRGTDRRLEPVRHEQFANGRALATGHDQAVQVLQVAWGADLPHHHITSLITRRAAQHRRVLGEVALDC